MSRLIRLCLCFIISLGLCFGSHAQIDTDGDGLIEIWNLTQLNNMRYNLAGTSYKSSASAEGVTPGCGARLTGKQKGKCHGYELTTDLDFSDTDAEGYDEDWDPVVQTAKETSGGGWTPIGDYGIIDSNRSAYDDNNLRIFTGTFDGNNHKIKNLYINLTTKRRHGYRYDSYVGLFGFVRDGTIRNVGLTGRHMRVQAVHSSVPEGFTVFEQEYADVGGLVGEISGGSIDNSYSTGTVFARGTWGGIGGLVGSAGGHSGSAITNCYSTGDVKAKEIGDSSYVGGLVGSSWPILDVSTIENCYATGNVTALTGSEEYEHAGTTAAGGLIGLAKKTFLMNCYATGEVSAMSIPPGGSVYAGGLVGSDFTWFAYRPPYIARLDASESSLSPERSYHSGTVDLPSGRAPTTHWGTAKTSDELKLLTAKSSGWSELNWDFCSDKEYPALRAYREDGNGNQIRGELLPGQAFLRPEAFAYPNPTSGILHVPTSESLAIVYSSSGIDMGTFAVSECQLDLSPLPAGIYLVRFSDGSVLRVAKY